MEDVTATRRRLTIAECIGAARAPANATTQSASDEEKEADFREKQGAYRCTNQLLAIATASILVIIY